ncbi:hypothetical protein OSB04_022272 [Centaurea solstitialis]|uniref:NAB domain-containing protein n=1 Tax=Centaurea solstitialis TaxID=347529 RepID=A0AA38SXF6_9ASTR|nr:hypothetical protein OSB04_022272 [Centaurea solstitialis]
MTKFRWNESLNMFRDHVDPEKEEQLKWIIIETDTKVKRITRLVKVLNAGNREAVQKKKSEVVYLIEDIHKQYQGLYALYEDLRELVKRRCFNEEDKEDCESSSSSLSYSLSMESSAGFFSPTSGSKTPNPHDPSHHDPHHHDPHHHDPHHHDPHHHDPSHYIRPKVAITDEESVKSEHSPSSSEDTSEVVKEALSVESVSSSYNKAEEREEDDRGRTVEKLMKETEYLRERLEEKEKKYQNLETKSSAKLKELEDRIVALNLELEEAANQQKGEHENEQFDSGNDEIDKTSMENSDFQTWVSELELAFKERESEVLKKMDDCEKIFKDKIDKYMDRLHNLQREVEHLQTQNEARKKLSYEKEKELELLRIQNQESQMELQKKTKEAAEALELLECLKIQNQESQMELQKKTKEAADSLELLERVKIQNQQSQMELQKKIKEAADSLELLESVKIQNQESQMELQKKTKEAAASLEQLESVKIQYQQSQMELQERTKEAADSLDLLEVVRMQYQQSQMELQKKTKEAADSLELLESLTQKLNEKTANEEGFVKERYSLQKRIKEFEVMIASIHNEARLTKQENEKQKATISQLEEKLQQKEGQIEGVKKELSTKMKTLEQKVKSSEIDKRELKGKNEVLAATLEQKDMLVNKLNHTAKTSFHTSVKKMGEMVDEFRKKSEDSIRILSQRIRVAEQLHNETKDWYKKTKDKCAQDRQDTDLALRSIKHVMASVSDTLNVSETLGLRFADCCEDFMNRVSKVSCEMHFVKDWVRRKNSAMVAVKEEVESLTNQLDNKEEENLGLREKVLKMENRVRELEKTVRELEKTVKENDETMMGLKEEKREAIRQLCVWIDYHRSRSEFLQRSIAELLTRNQSQRMV